MGQVVYGAGILPYPSPSIYMSIFLPIIVFLLGILVIDFFPISVCTIFAWFWVILKCSLLSASVFLWSDFTFPFAFRYGFFFVCSPIHIPSRSLLCFCH